MSTEPRLAEYAALIKRAGVTFDHAEFENRFPELCAFYRTDEGSAAAPMEAVAVHDCFEVIVARRGGDRSADVELWRRILRAVRSGTVEALVAQEGGAA